MIDFHTDMALNILYWSNYKELKEVHKLVKILHFKII